MALMIEADYNHRIMFFLVPLQTSHPINPKWSFTLSLLPDVTLQFLAAKENIHIHMDELNIWLFSLRKDEEKKVPYFLTCVEKRSVTGERQSQMTLTFLFAEMPVDYSVKWRMRDRQERKQRERQRREKKPKNKNRIILRGKQTIWISTDIPKVFLAVFTDKFLLP